MAVGQVLVNESSNLRVGCCNCILGVVLGVLCRARGEGSGCLMGVGCASPGTRYLQRPSLKGRDLVR